MARSQYTYTPGYSGANRSPAQQNRKAQGPRSDFSMAPPLRGGFGAQPTPQRIGQGAEKAQRSMLDTLVLASLFIALPLVGVLSLFVHALLWLFVLVAIGSLTGMLGLRCFTPRARMAVAATLVVSMTAAAIALINPAAQGGRNAYMAQGDPTAAYGYNAPPAAPTAPIGGQAGGAPPATGTGAPEAQMTISPLASDGELVMNSYLQMWRDENYEGMVQYTSPSWREGRDAPHRQLSWNHSGWKLIKWDIKPEPSSPTADSLTLTVSTTLMRDTKSTQLYTCTYKAMLFRDGDRWYVDPNSMQGNPEAVDPNKEPPPVATNESGQPIPANPTTKPDTTLWYNPDGGSKYHLDPKCKEINSKYYSQMKSFPYSELSRHAKLKPCKTCHAPQ